MATKPVLSGPQSPRPQPPMVDAESVNVPRHKVRADAGMHRAMRQALLKAVPGKAPGPTQAELRAVVAPHLPADLLPGRAQAGWWAKAVQIDLETKQLLVLKSPKSLRWHRNSRR